MKINRALISVSDKTDLKLLAQALVHHQVELIASGGTAKTLKELGYDVTPVEKITGNPEAFGGRMKTISFQMESALLFKRESEQDCQEAQNLGIEPIDLVVCNLYPFEQKCREDLNFDELIEFVDVGGPTMIRSGAKNYKHVCVITDPRDYTEFSQQFEGGETSLEFRSKCALKAFRHLSHYDSMIVRRMELEFEGVERTQHIDGESLRELRYGENPHQRAWVSGKSLLAGAVPLQGKALSYNNYLDAEAAWSCMSDLKNHLSHQSVVTVVKHLNPCGVALGKDMSTALERAWAGDPISAFGGILAFSEAVTEREAKWLSDKFIEVIVAPGFNQGAKEIFQKKKNLRLIELPLFKTQDPIEVRSMAGGFLLQSKDQDVDVEWESVAGHEKINQSLLSFGTMVTKHLKSNAISLVRESDDCFELIGAGMGNPNRVISLEQAFQKAKQNGFQDFGQCWLISDAFFPFADTVELAYQYGIKKIVQPGGSIKDKDVIQKAQDLGVSMIFTGRRHFKH